MGSCWTVSGVVGYLGIEVWSMVDKQNQYKSWYDPSTGEVTINDSTQREQFDNWWLDHGDDIGLSDQLRTFSKPH